VFDLFGWGLSGLLKIFRETFAGSKSLSIFAVPNRESGGAGDKMVNMARRFRGYEKNFKKVLVV